MIQHEIESIMNAILNESVKQLENINLDELFVNVIYEWSIDVDFVKYKVIIKPYDEC